MKNNQIQLREVDSEYLNSKIGKYYYTSKYMNENLGNRHTCNICGSTWCDQTYEKHNENCEMINIVDKNENKSDIFTMQLSEIMKANIVYKEKTTVKVNHDDFICNDEDDYRDNEYGGGWYSADEDDHLGPW